jgi:hypothetical protein
MLVLLAWVALAGRAEEGVDEAAEAPIRIKGSAACLRLDRIQDFQVIDSQTLIIWRQNRKEPHKVTLFQGCPRLRSADAIFFDTGGWDRLCGRGGEYLVVTRPSIPSPRDRLFPPRSRFPAVEQELIEERCGVAGVDRINDDVVHELLVQSGAAVPRGPERPDQMEVLPGEETDKQKKRIKTIKKER